MNPSSPPVASSPVPERGSLPSVMGILNVTPDSFSDGGLHFACSAAVDSALQMVADGAGIIDVGGESTRPGAVPVSEQEEISRVALVIEQIHKRSDVVLSIDTRRSVVARVALAAGATMINDISALRFDPEMREVVASSGVAVVLMHMRGEPRTMQQFTAYENLLADVIRELRLFREQALAGGIAARQIYVDPGIGFAKTFEQNLELLARCGELRAIGPLVVGSSRKAFIGQITGRAAGPERAAGSLAAVAAAVRGGAAILRVHDVRQTVDFVRMMKAIEERS